MTTILNLVLHYIQTLPGNIVPSWETFCEYIQPMEVIYVNPHVTEELIQQLDIRFKPYLIAYRWIGKHIQKTHQLNWSNHWSEEFEPDDYYQLFTKRGLLRRNYYETLDESIVNLIYSWVYTVEEKTILEHYTKRQLQTLVKQNYYPLEFILNKTLKYHWVKAYIYTKRWGFNTFAVQSKLPDDVLRFIRSYL